MERIYLDHQASAPVHPEVFSAMEPYFSQYFGTPASVHQDGMKSREAMKHAREQVAGAINAEYPEEILFTSGATESVNLAVKGTAYASQRRGKHIVLTEIEHPAVVQSVEFLKKQGFSATYVPVDAEGRADSSAIASAVQEDTILVCLHLANHDIGTLQPIREIAEVAQSNGIPLLVDAAYSYGLVPIDVRDLGISLLALAPHRFHGPKGVGILYRHRRARLTNLIHGGTQEDGRRAGTENIPGAVGAGVAIELAARERTRRVDHVSPLQARLWQGLASRVPHVWLNGPSPGADRIPNQLNLGIEFIEGEGLALLLDMQGISVASGTACVSKALEPSYVLSAIGVNRSLAVGSILITLGYHNTPEAVDFTVDQCVKQVEKLRNMSPTWDELQQGRVNATTPEWQA